MANDTQREKARAIFGKAFFEDTKPQAQPKNSAYALQQRANARPIPTYKVGGVVKKNTELAAKRAVKAEQDFSKPLADAVRRAAMKGMPVMKEGGKASDEYTAKRVLARMEAGNYKDGGSVDKYKSKLDRKMADIEKDYQKALAKGKSDSIAKAKYEQRMADARDDYAKWTKGDRTQTKAAERAAEASLSEARKTKGASIVKRDAPVVAAQAAKSLEAKPEIGIKPIRIEAPKAKAKVRPVAKPAARAVRKVETAVPGKVEAPAGRQVAKAEAVNDFGKGFSGPMRGGFTRSGGKGTGSILPAKKEKPRISSSEVLAGVPGLGAIAAGLMTRQQRQQQKAAEEKARQERLSKISWTEGKGGAGPMSGKYSVGKYAVGGAGKVRKGQAKGK